MLNSPHDRSLNILYLVHRAPYPPDKGDRIRSYHLLRFLNNHGKVWLGCLSDGKPSPEVTAKLESLSEDLAIVPLGSERKINAAKSLLLGKTATEGHFASRKLERVVKDWAGSIRFDVVVVFCSSMAQYLVPELGDVPMIFESVDVDSEKWFQYAERFGFPKNFLYRLEGRRLRQLERQLGLRANAVTLVTEPEAEIFRSIQPKAHVVAIPMGVDSHYFAPVSAADGHEVVKEEPACVFVGMMDYAANVDGVCWFAESVWPLVRKQHPEAMFRVVGRNPSPAVLGLQRIEGIEIVGAVPDVRPYVARSAISVTPLQVARGVQNKVLEALSMGKAAIVSPGALSGLGTRPGHELLCAATVEEWVQSISQLLNDPQRRRELGAHGRKFVEQHHNWEHCLKPFAELLPKPKARFQATDRSPISQFVGS